MSRLRLVGLLCLLSCLWSCRTVHKASQTVMEEIVSHVVDTACSVSSFEARDTVSVSVRDTLEASHEVDVWESVREWVDTAGVRVVERHVRSAGSVLVVSSLLSDSLVSRVEESVVVEESVRDSASVVMVEEVSKDVRRSPSGWRLFLFFGGLLLMAVLLWLLRYIVHRLGGAQG